MSRPLNPADGPVLDRLAAALGRDGVRPPEPRYLEEPRGRHHGRAAAVLRPVSVDEVGAAVRICAEARVGIVPYSGGTGLVGGQVFEAGPLPVILSFERMTRVRDLDLTDGVMVAEAGAVLADLQAAARAAGRLFPLSLASEGSARIGGLLATNAGGLNVLRYGNARDLCLGVEAVLADGSVLHGLSRVVKDNMGYDLRHLIIGSEGTLGLITAASLRLHPQSGETATAWIAVASPAAALDLLHDLRAALGNTISAFELMQVQALGFIAETLPLLPLPPAMGTGWLVLAEAADAAGAEVGRRLEAALAAALERGRAADALVAQSDAQRAVFWGVRELIPEANRRLGAVSSHDISLPPARLAEFVARGGAALAALDPELRINCFGHLGDGNLHYNVFAPKGRSRSEYERFRRPATRALHDLAHALGGSVGAEHGVGRLKVADLVRYGDPGEARGHARDQDGARPRRHPESGRPA